MNEEKIRQAAVLFLEGIGEDVSREGLLETPDRIARMCAELFCGLQQDAGEHLRKTFSVSSNNLVLERDIPFQSICEHHLLPFIGCVHIAYIPNGKVAGLSKLARTVEVFARRPQIQEQLTDQICSAIMEHLDAQGAMVVVQAEHMCMTMRGVCKPGTKTVTVATRGCFEKDDALQSRVLQLIEK